MNICIIGGGLTSLSLAKNLINKKINVQLYQENKTKNLFSSRTIGISKKNIEFFTKEIQNISKKILWKIKKIEIYSEKINKEKLINFEADKDQLFSIIRNYKLFKLLEKNLSKNKYFKSIFINEKNLSFLNKYELIINCDTSNIVAKRYFSKKIIKKYNSCAYTTIISHEEILNDTAYQIFTKKGPLAFLPISNKETSIVYSVHNLNKQSDENIEQLIKDKNFKYKIRYMGKINSFELESLNLRSYYHGNILAFGDLLHKIHPLAGQGFNMTIRDIKILLDITKKKLDLGLPLDSSVNSEFQKNLKYKNFLFANGVDLIHELFNMERKINIRLLSNSVKLISNYPFINKMFTKIADRGILL